MICKVMHKINKILGINRNEWVLIDNLDDFYLIRLADVQRFKINTRSNDCIRLMVKDKLDSRSNEWYRLSDKDPSYGKIRNILLGLEFREETSAQDITPSDMMKNAINNIVGSDLCDGDINRQTETVMELKEVLRRQNDLANRDS